MGFKSNTHENECLNFKLWKVVGRGHTYIKYWFDLIGVEVVKTAIEYRMAGKSVYFDYALSGQL